MALQYVAYDDSNMEPGKFYIVEVNKDLVPNLLPVTMITDRIAANEVAIQSLSVAVTQEQLSDLISQVNNDKIVISDNQARINNLENQNLKDNFIAGMELASIRKEFVNSNYIEVAYGRREINNIMVYGLVEDSATEKIYKEITSGIELKYHEKYNNGELIEKIVVIETIQPITGYVLIL